MDAQDLLQPVAEPPKVEPDYGFTVAHQKVDLDIDFSTQSLTGRCEIVILPLHNRLEEIRLDARQCTIKPNSITVNGLYADFVYQDPMEKLNPIKKVEWGVHQAELQKERLKPMTDDMRSNGPLIITLPVDVHMDEADPLSERAATPLTLQAVGAASASAGLDAPPSATPKPSIDQILKFKPMTVVINFSIEKFRDGLHFVGLAEGDMRFPHVYTRHAMDAGTASCIFPCVDDSSMRCVWEISIKCSRTLGDALKRRPVPVPKKGLTNGAVEEYEIPLSDDEKLLELVVVCTGEQVNETTDLVDSTKKIVTFKHINLLAPQHVGFAIGPFETVDLSQFREVEDDEKLGQGQSKAISAFCLPGRSDEVRHTCAPLTHALDYFHMGFGSYPFEDCRFVFVDEQTLDIEHAASLSICSNRLLFGPRVIDPEIENIRTLVHAIATQWFGINIVPSQRTDRWVTVGLSHFITGLYMKNLCGNNDYAFRQKTLSDKLVELDFQRLSLHALGEIMSLGAFEYEFMKLKAPLVMFILDKRLIKASGSAGLLRIIGKIIVAANTNSETIITTESFRKTCEKVTKYRQTDSFWKEWIYGSGCPRFLITQKFNKKRLCVEMNIIQKQDTQPTQRELQKGSFLREIKEEAHQVYCLEVQPVFTGPMTIRIHEADGTPYEHIVEIREGSARIDIPYTTKYKRLKRNKRQKDMQNATANADPNAEGGEDTLIYCLGDTLQGQELMEEWGLTDWNTENQAKMETESYEWIRVDADFEWICEKQFQSMPAWMYVSQLQQDRDVVAQQESMSFLKNMAPHKLVSTFLIRTLMDTRYFHGIRTMAAEALKNHASPECGWVGLKQLEKAYMEFFCVPGTNTPRPNDFSDKRAYKVEMAIIQSIAKIRDTGGRCPKQCRSFLMDILKFNENTNNKYSDNFKVTTVLSALTDSLIPMKDAANVLDMGEDEDDPEPMEFQNAVVEQLTRYAGTDEWVDSYHNILTYTVLDCQQRLMKAKVTPVNGATFAAYLIDGVSEFVKVKAFEALIDLGFLTNDAVAALLLNAASTEPSPYTRRKLFEIFCVGIAGIAFGENTRPEKVSAQTNGLGTANGGQDVLMGEAGAVGDGDGLLVEEDATAAAEARAALLARSKTIDGALLALKKELKDNEKLKISIWKAVQSPCIGLAEHLDLLDVCRVTYEAVESMHLKLRLPRMWAVTHAGKGKLIFKETDKIRTKALTPAPNMTVVVEPPKGLFSQTSQHVLPLQPKPTIKFSNVPLNHHKSPSVASVSALPAHVPFQPPKPVVLRADDSMKPPAKPNGLKRSAPDSSDDPPKKRSKVVKLPLSEDGFKKALKIQASPSNPAPPRAKSSTKSASPAPTRPSPRPSPAPKASPNPSPGPRTGLPSAPAAPRSALPGSAPVRTSLPGLPKPKMKIKFSNSGGNGSSRGSVPPASGGGPKYSASPAPTSGAQTPQPSAPPAVKAARKPLPDAGNPAKKRFMIMFKNGKASTYKTSS